MAHVRLLLIRINVKYFVKYFIRSTLVWDYYLGVTDQIAGEDTLLSPISSSADVLLEVVATRSSLEFYKSIWFTIS